jgi:hypothetical protein
MLRQALAEAKKRNATESSRIDPAEQDAASYGATSVADSQQPSHTSGDEETLDVEGEEEDDDEDDDDSWDEDEESHEENEPTLFHIVYHRIRSCVLVVANVENLWDDPPDPQTRRLSQLIVLFWFVVLACSYAAERSSFKLLVDRAGSFRLFAVGMVTSVHAILLGLFLLMSLCFKQDQDSKKIKLGISVVDVALMALLDTVALIMMFLSGLHVPPSLIVILIQFTLPLTAFLTQFVHPDGRWTFVASIATNDASARTDRSQGQSSSNNDLVSSSPTDLFHTYRFDGQDDDDIYAQPLISTPPTTAAAAEGEPMEQMGGLSSTHVWGAIIIALAVFLALIPAVYSIIDPSVFLYADPIPVRTAINTLLYVSSCIPAAASQLYKEHTFLHHRQPINMNYLNLLLSIFQLIFAAIVAPLVFGLQGLGSSGDWTLLYPSKQFGENMVDGLKCFFWGLNDEDQESKYAEGSYCDFCLGFTIFHALSIICIGVAVDKIVNAGATKVMYRGMSAGIILAALIMHEYDMRIIDFSYGRLVDGLNLVSVVLLILGSEVYHRVGLKESTFETTFPEVHFEYDDG